MVNDFDQAFYIQSPGNLIDGCQIYDFPGNGVQIYNGYGPFNNNNVVRNNTIHDGRSTFSGQRHTGMTVAGSGNQIYNNVVYGIPNNGANPSAGIYIYGASSSSIYNNTLYGNAHEGLVVETGSLGTVVRNNISYNNGGGNFRDSGGGTSQSNNMFGTNPQFVNPAGADFRLQSTSPAVDAGTSVSMVTTDLMGTARPQARAYDIGAFEYLSSSGTLSPPTGLRIVP
jgi:parallel beta-helix repeat protein